MQFRTSCNGFLINILALFSFVFLVGCGGPAKTDDELRTLADTLAHRYIIADGHVDLPYRLKLKNFRIERQYMGIPIQTNDGDFDYVRARKGGLSAPFMSIYIPSANQLNPDFGKALADSLINMVEGIIENHPDKFASARTVSDVEKNFREGRISLPMGMENAAPVGNDLSNVKYFFDRGIRYMTLTHSKDNQICDSSGDTTRTWGGLSPFGRDVVREMNRVGIMVDISHVDDSSFYQVMKLTSVPCIASHSSCRAFAPTVRRDMTDDMIVTMGKHGGVINVNFYNAFLNGDVAKRNKQIDSLMTANQVTAADSAKYKELLAEFEKTHPAPLTDVQTVANHIDHIVKLAGIDHVGLGSDFDGVGGGANLPDGLKDVSQYPNLIFELLKRGYKEEDIAKICSGNFLRVWREVEKASGQQ